MIHPAPLLLDTHVWIWLMEGMEHRLRSDVRKRLEDAGRNGHLRVHPLSLWEVGTLVRKGRLTLTGPVERWAEAVLSVQGVTLTPLTPAIALDASLLPDDFHGDPVDRVLVATARSLGATLVTADRQIVLWADTQRPPVQVMDVS